MSILFRQPSLVYKAQTQTGKGQKYSILVSFSLLLMVLLDTTYGNKHLLGVLLIIKIQKQPVKLKAQVAFIV
jgi:hypothetical protein